MGIWEGKGKDLGLKQLFKISQLVHVCLDDFEFCGLKGIEGTIYGGLNLVNGGPASAVDKRRDVKLFAGMIQHVADDSGRTLAEYVTKHAIELEVGNGETILGTVFLAGGAGSQFDPITAKVAQLANVFGWDETARDKVMLEQVGNPLRVLLIGLFAFDSFDELGMANHHVAGGFKDVMDRDPIFARGFHANIPAIVRDKPVLQCS